MVLPVTFLLLLFPDGHLPSPRWRWFAWSLGVALVVVYLSILLYPGLLEESIAPTARNPLGIDALGSVPRRRAGVDVGDPHRGDRFVDVARGCGSADRSRDRTTPAAMAAHGGGFRGGCSIRAR